MARGTKDLIKSLMEKLDLLHTKYVHVFINNHFFESDEYEEYMDMLDEWSIDGYFEYYNWLLRCDETSKEKGRAAESANQVMAEFLSVWKRKVCHENKSAVCRVVVRNFGRDGGRPTTFGEQALIVNHFMLL